MCNCRLTEAIIAILIIAFYFWETDFSGWVIVIAAAVLLIHSFACKSCGMPERAPRSAKKRR